MAERIEIIIERRPEPAESERRYLSIRPLDGQTIIWDLAEGQEIKPSAQEPPESRSQRPGPVLLWLGIIIAAAGLGALVAVAAALNGIGLVS